jgi:hypothetical protein
MMDVSGKPLAFTKDGGLIIFDTIEECRACDWKKLKLSRIIVSPRYVFEDWNEAETKIERYEKLLEENDIDYHDE